MAQYYNRYEDFEENGEQYTVPFIKLPPKQTDKFGEYNKNRSRLDKISQEHYGNPFNGWLILAANPQYGGLETNIPDGAWIRIPFPYNESKTIYKELIKRHRKLYGQ